MNIPIYPEKTPLTIDHQKEIHRLLSPLSSGISEFTFAGLYLFRHTYQYQVSLTPAYCEDRKNELIVTGREKNSSGEPEEFVMLPQGVPKIKLADTLLQDASSIKNLSEDDAEPWRIPLERRGFCVNQDRNNFDYLYTRKDLAELSGRKYHKKRNLVNAFINNYNYEEKRITQENRSDLYTVLDAWVEEKEFTGDFTAAKEAIDMIDTLGLAGCITYIDGQPKAYSMGETYCRGSMFAVHFEKGIGSYKGIYQFINQSFASMMDSSVTYINREQDLGNAGLRQAKMSYRPTGFVKKYRVRPSNFSPCEETEEE